jgi:large subunit ribosomal protein L17
MRHGDKINNLGRTASHRRALLANLAIALIEHKRITTTLAKARALRRYIEPLVTKAKDNTTHSRRVVFSYLQNKEAITELFGTVASKVGDRPGGYVRVIKLGFRRGDGAETAMIEFVDFNEAYNIKDNKGGESKKKTRRGRRKSSGTAPVVAAPVSKVAVVEEPAEEVAPVVEETAAVVAAAEETAAPAEETPAAEGEKKDGE